MVMFGLGLLAGGLLAVLLLALLLRLIGATQLRQPPRTTATEPGWGSEPDLTLTLSRHLLRHLIAGSLRGLSLPLIELRDPQIVLEPDALLKITARGDTALLGGQLIVLRTRIVPAEVGVRVQTESAGMRGLGEVAGPLTAKLDERINAALAERLALTAAFEVLTVGGSAEAVTITVRRRE